MNSTEERTVHSIEEIYKTISENESILTKSEIEHYKKHIHSIDEAQKTIQKTKQKEEEYKNIIEQAIKDKEDHCVELLKRRIKEERGNYDHKINLLEHTLGILEENYSARIFNPATIFLPGTRNQFSANARKKASNLEEMYESIGELANKRARVYELGFELDKKDITEKDREDLKKTHEQLLREMSSIKEKIEKNNTPLDSILTERNVKKIWDDTIESLCILTKCDSEECDQTLQDTILKLMAAKNEEDRFFPDTTGYKTFDERFKYIKEFDEDLSNISVQEESGIVQMYYNGVRLEKEQKEQMLKKIFIKYNTIFREAIFEYVLTLHDDKEDIEEFEKKFAELSPEEQKKRASEKYKDTSDTRLAELDKKIKDSKESLVKINAEQQKLEAQIDGLYEKSVIDPEKIKEHELLEAKKSRVVHDLVTPERLKEYLGNTPVYAPRYREIIAKGTGVYEKDPKHDLLKKKLRRSIMAVPAKTRPWRSLAEESRAAGLGEKAKKLLDGVKSGITTGKFSLPDPLGTNIDRLEYSIIHARDTAERDGLDYESVRIRWDQTGDQYAVFLLKGSVEYKADITGGGDGISARLVPASDQDKNLFSGAALSLSREELEEHIAAKEQGWVFKPFDENKKQYSINHVATGEWRGILKTIPRPDISPEKERKLAKRINAPKLKRQIRGAIIELGEGFYDRLSMPVCKKDPSGGKLQKEIEREFSDMLRENPAYGNEKVEELINLLRKRLEEKKEQLAQKAQIGSESVLTAIMDIDFPAPKDAAIHSSKQVTARMQEIVMSSGELFRALQSKDADERTYALRTLLEVYEGGAEESEMILREKVDSLAPYALKAKAKSRAELSESLHKDFLKNVHPYADMENMFGALLLVGMTGAAAPVFATILLLPLLLPLLGTIFAARSAQAAEKQAVLDKDLFVQEKAKIATHRLVGCGALFEISQRIAAGEDIQTVMSRCNEIFNKYDQMSAQLNEAYIELFSMVDPDQPVEPGSELDRKIQKKIKEIYMSVMDPEKGVLLTEESLHRTAVIQMRAASLKKAVEHAHKLPILELRSRENGADYFAPVSCRKLIESAKENGTYAAKGDLKAIDEDAIIIVDNAYDKLSDAVNANAEDIYASMELDPSGQNLTQVFLEIADRKMSDYVAEWKSGTKPGQHSSTQEFVAETILEKLRDLQKQCGNSTPGTTALYRGMLLDFAMRLVPANDWNDIADIRDDTKRRERIGKHLEATIKEFIQINNIQYAMDPDKDPMSSIMEDVLKILAVDETEIQECFNTKTVPDRTDEEKKQDLLDNTVIFMNNTINSKATEKFIGMGSSVQKETEDNVAAVVGKIPKAAESGTDGKSKNMSDAEITKQETDVPGTPGADIDDASETEKTQYYADRQL